MLNCTSIQREGQCQNLNDFTEEVHQDITNITSALGWTVESIETDNDNRLVCPYNSSHRIGKEMLDQHLEFCQWKEEGYAEFDVPLSEPMLPLSSPFSMKLDASLQNSILQEAKEKDPTMKVGSGERLIPRTSDRIFTDFTSDEKKVLYEYVVSNTVKIDIGHDITDDHNLKSDDKEDRKLSFLELLVQERNLKRRRAKHRGVHTNKKSNTEILREVINQQMELYTQVPEVHATCGTKTVDIVNVPRSNRHPDEAILDSSLSFNESPSKYRHFQDSEDYHGNFNSRYNHTYERTEATYASCSKDREKRERCSRTTTESWKAKKHHKRRRSHSREQNYNRGNIKSRKTEKSINGASYFRRNH
ncbi:U11/U12 small nuclear ribonucleoprotein 48 kDa protein-like isoform X1 [Hylaeus anthracinus]|uniref:U11/U12 small nuclear ribonucleoprotein 48 kDa protein-like isoform X1 n=2 Tax=Hylaeus anthracinus TaxID=313031 RepID=UPI0023BA179E|nr:U11/U12 small nuclear ribonucleoprotein 48 kDa protein-like isoform X1 [Hylaeus anthracinus]